MIDRFFRRHPRSLNETYLEHQQVALSFAGQLMLAGAACAIHAVIPGLFERTASQAIARLHERMVAGGRRHAPLAGQPAR